mmetsp:Transcript_111947/g.316399  ORF Transcript_111947/g.316399 Transcript_111947/m.316399 type:complete len:408 (+) Transcript_111947:131-1354(+)
MSTPFCPRPGSDAVVWSSDDSVSINYRIPSLVLAPSGDLLAFCEARFNKGLHGADTGRIAIVSKRSRDEGRTWEGEQTVWEDGDNTCGNPCCVVDRSAGRVLLFACHNLGEDTEAEIINGTSKGTRTVWVLTSDDSGASWAAPREITSMVKESEWTWYATGPGVGIRVERGEYAGRIVVPCCHHSAGKDRYLYQSHVFFSDDGGKTFELGGSVAEKTNECQVVELENGRLLLNMRQMFMCPPWNRRQALSADGGRTWLDERMVPELIEPLSGCMASITRLRWAGQRAFDEDQTSASSEGQEKGVLLFSNPACRLHRFNATLKMSRDDGRTWPRCLDLPLGFPISGYSCLQVLPSGAVVCLLEWSPSASGIFLLGYSLVCTRIDADALENSCQCVPACCCCACGPCRC